MFSFLFGAYRRAPEPILFEFDGLITLPSDVYEDIIQRVESDRRCGVATQKNNGSTLYYLYNRKRYAIQSRTDRRTIRGTWKGYV